MLFCVAASPATSAPMSFDRDPIPLTLNLGATLRFFQSSFKLRSPMDLVAAAQLIFPVVCTDAVLVCCPTALPTWLRCWSAAVLLLVSTKSLQLRQPTSTVPFPQLVQQKSCITTRLNCNLTVPAGFFNHILMSNATDRHAATTQGLCQHCHWQCAFHTCVCFQEDKESTCCWPWQVPSVLVGLDA